MRTQFLFLSTLLAAAFALAPVAFAQEPGVDSISQIDDEEPTSTNATVFFNAANCAEPEFTTYDVTLGMGNGVTSAYMWAAGGSGNCQVDDPDRLPASELCAELASSPRTVGDNATITNMLLSELISTGVVDCDNSALEGQPFKIYSFRNVPPAGIVPPADYGIANFTVDVTPPVELTLDSPAVQNGTTFTVSWVTPTDSIAQYNLYQGTDSDPTNATNLVGTAGQNAKSISISSSALRLEPEETTYLFVSAVDMAAMTIGNGNEGPRSVATTVTALATGGFCDDPEVDCSGCSASPMMLADGQPSSGVWLVGLVFAVVCARRLRR